MGTIVTPYHVLRSKISKQAHERDSAEEERAVFFLRKLVLSSLKKVLFPA